MTSTIDPTKIGKPARARRHVRTLTGMYFPTAKCHYCLSYFIVVATGYLPEKDASGKDKWPRGEEKVWREGMRTIDRGEFTTSFCCLISRSQHTKIQMLIRSRSLLLTTYKRRLLVSATILVRPFLLILP